MISRLSSCLMRLSRPTLGLSTFLALLLIWLVDYASGPQFSISIFYLLPIGLATWFLSRGAGLTTAIAAAAAWLVNDLVTNPVYDHPFIPYWNAAVRLGIFMIVTAALASLREARLRQEELIAFVVHDLRSPLGIILSSLEMIDMIAEEKRGSGEIGEFVDLSLLSGRQMLILIDSLLDLARLESGKMPVQLESIAVAPFLEEVGRQLSAMARQKGVAIRTDVAPDVPSVCADRALLGRVLVNLISNAVKFSPVDGTVRLEVRPDAGSLVICVADEGPGIPDKWQRQVFDKFEQVQARKGGVAIGSGLGLAFCRMAVEAQGGRIWLEQGREKGTVLYLSLPAAI